MLANRFCSDLSIVVSLCVSQEDSVEVFLSFKEVGNSSPFGNWGGAVHFFLGCILWGGDSSAKVWMGGWMGGTTIPMAFWQSKPNFHS
jgi:hypothetical protein